MLSKKEQSFILLPLLLADSFGEVIAWLLLAAFGVFLVNLDTGFLRRNPQEDVNAREVADKVIDSSEKELDNEQATHSDTETVIQDQKSPATAENADKEKSDHKEPVTHEDSAIVTRDINRSPAAAKPIPDEIANNVPANGLSFLDDILSVPEVPEFTSKYSKKAKKNKRASDLLEKAVVNDTILSHYEATTARKLLDNHQYLDKHPAITASRSFDSKTAEAPITHAISDKYVDNTTRAASTPRQPFLANYELSTAQALSIARKHITNLTPIINKEESAPRQPPRQPFLADYEQSTAHALYIAKGHVASWNPINKREEGAPRQPPRQPFLADYEQSTAQALSIAKEHIARLTSIVKKEELRQPFLAEFEQSTAHALSVAKDYITNLSSINKEGTASQKQTEADLSSEIYGSTIGTNESPSSTKSEATAAIQSNISKTEEQAPTSFESVSGEISPVASTSTSTRASSDDSVSADDFMAPTPTTSTPHHSIYSTEDQQATRNIRSAADEHAMFLAERNEASKPNEAGQHVITSSDTSIVDSPYSSARDKLADMPWGETTSGTTSLEDVKAESPYENTDQVPYNNPVYNVPCTYYPNCTNRKCKFVHPGPVIISTALKRSSSLSSKRMSRDERILKQAQNYIPQSKARCNHWPFCTNNHCKYTHPTKDCRYGDNCPFQNSCMFIHPIDRMDSQKKNRGPK